MIKVSYKLSVTWDFSAQASSPYKNVKPRGWEESCALFLLMNFVLFLKDSRERRTRRGHRKLGAFIQGSQLLIDTTTSLMCTQPVGARANPHQMGSVDTVQKGHSIGQPFLQGWWRGLLGAAPTEYLWPSSISCGRAMGAQIHGSL